MSADQTTDPSFSLSETTRAPPPPTAIIPRPCRIATEYTGQSNSFLHVWRSYRRFQRTTAFPSPPAANAVPSPVKATDQTGAFKSAFADSFRD